MPVTPISPIDRQIAAKLREVRMHDGFTLRELGLVLGVSWQIVQRYEQGKARLSADKLHTLAVFLEVPVGWFLGTETFELGPSHAKRRP